MTDVLNRDELERKLARTLGKQFTSVYKKLLRQLGDPPSQMNLPSDFWETAGADMQSAVAVILQEIYKLQADALLATITVGVDAGLIHTSAVEWARKYAGELIRNLMGTTRENVGSLVGNYFDQGWTRGDLEEALVEWFGPRRAENIAVTEVTRASVEGEKAVAEEIMRENDRIEMVPTFVTNRDDIVCPICEDMDGVQIDDDADYPPLHVNCRCWVNYEMRVR